MQYILKQKYFSLRDKFTISDTQGTPHYQIESKIFTFPKKFWMSDMAGREIMLVRAKLLSLFGKFEFRVNEDNVIGYIKRRFAHFVKRCTVETQYGKWKVKGNVFSWSFDVYDENKNRVIEIDKKILQIADSYSVKTVDNRYDDIAIAIALCLDAWFHPRH